jgi:hypothetical protein
VFDDRDCTCGRIDIDTCQRDGTPTTLPVRSCVKESRPSAVQASIIARFCYH